ncbi:GmrSD restriction endonuclease domain-containing protein [Dendrosporobacter sp. 1207_IL3150]|uniref:GmrSD restriction endonuclease domain-containing protein n=1 Tax=Dendrosporobacter sp. 1207_IL3150 TaxID=3084054 RepID=UPI002FDB4DE6
MANLKTDKYSVNQHSIGIILSWVQSGEIAIPEIQRPFVWDASKVRDLMDSLYQGYPVGYLIAWKNPNIRLKDGTVSAGKKILIDGQQRVTALTAAVLGMPVVNKEYRKGRIIIAFHPQEERFEVLNPAIQKDPAWIPDISPIMRNEVKLFTLVKEYCEKNPAVSEEHLHEIITNLTQILHKQIGLIELAPDLDIETVTEIFIRINSKGVVLSQADFAMSKIAADEKYGGNKLRKCIDYFCHLAVAPEFVSTIQDVDRDFTGSEYFARIKWMKDENDDLYDPDYTDVLRVAFTSEFNRGKLADLVSLLSGRNFETRTFEEDIARQSFVALEKGVLNFTNETNFKRFIMIIRSTGFIAASLVRSQNAVNFAYILYLKLKAMGYQSGNIEHFVRRWYVISVLTGRYSGSPESQFDYDIRNISAGNFRDYLNNVEAGELSDAFWNTVLVQNLNTSVTSSPYFHVFLASQIKGQDRGFLSKEITVHDLVSYKGDIHHVFPKEYLKRNGVERGQYNQIANYVYTQSEVNIKIGKKPPNEYMADVLAQCNGNELKYGGIRDEATLRANLTMSCIPDDIFNMDISRYQEFLEIRRSLMAQKIKEYYFSL